MVGAIRQALCGLLCMVGFVLTKAHAADQAAVEAAIAQLEATEPAFKKLTIHFARTRNKAYVLEEADGPVLTFDTAFLAELDQTAVTFVVAHEYAHVWLKHGDAIEAKAMELTGKADGESAFRALTMQPVNMELLHTQNRKLELEADVQAKKWLDAVGVNPCVPSVLATFQTGGMFQPMAPTHPPYSARREVVCGK